jgi:predicted DNA-binding transcriptional regulator YafY
LAYLVTFSPSSAPANLAAEFGVTLRTIQRDLNDRLSFLPVEKADGRYHLHPSALGKLSHQDSWQMAILN